MNQESGCEEKNNSNVEEAMLAKNKTATTCERNSKIFSDIESAEGKCCMFIPT